MKQGETKEACNLNEPHEALQFPIPYLFLKKYPKCLHVLNVFYSFRWRVSYCLQRKIPLLHSQLFKHKTSLTWCDLLGIIPFLLIFIFGTLTSFVDTSVTASGNWARIPLVLCFITANHNSILTILVGIPFDRAIFYHKVSGVVTLIVGAFHTYAAYVKPTNKEQDDPGTNFATFLTGGQINLSGTILLTLISGMLLSSIRVVRNICYEFFYYFHIIFAMGMVVCAFYHSGILVVILAAIFWGGDMLIRRLLMPFVLYPRKASIKMLSKDLLEISFPKEIFCYNPGQYLFIAIPELSLFQWHPFSISSSPYQEIVTIHVFKNGDWTSGLHDIASVKNEVTIFIEGPYGSVSIDLFSNRYKMLMLLSGGIGVTPMQSICQQMTHEASKGKRELKKIWFLWSSRTIEPFENMSISRHAISHHNALTDQLKQENTAVEASVSWYLKLHRFLEQSIGDLVKLISSGGDDQELDEEVDANCNEEAKFDDMLVDECFGDCALYTDLFLTSNDNKDYIVTEFPYLKQARPDLKRTFLEMRKEAIIQGEARVAVCICATKKFRIICQKACAEYSDSNVKFDIHYEQFD